MGDPYINKGSGDGLKPVGYVSSSNSEICVFTPVNAVTGCGSIIPIDTLTENQNDRRTHEVRRQYFIYSAPSSFALSAGISI